MINYKKMKIKVPKHPQNEKLISVKDTKNSKVKNPNVSTSTKMIVCFSAECFFLLFWYESALADVVLLVVNMFTMKEKREVHSE